MVIPGRFKKLLVVIEHGRLLRSGQRVELAIQGQKVQIALVEPGLPLVIHVGHQVHQPSALLTGKIVGIIGVAKDIRRLIGGDHRLYLFLIRGKIRIDVSHSLIDPFIFLIEHLQNLLSGLTARGVAAHVMINVDFDRFLRIAHRSHAHKQAKRQNDTQSSFHVAEILRFINFERQPFLSMGLV